MNIRETIARLVFVVIIIGSPVGFLGYRHIIEPGLSLKDTISIESYAPEYGGFSPSIVRVDSGKEVTLRFTSMDVTHGIAIGPGLGVDLGHIDPGEHGEITLIFDEPGTYTYYCTTWCSPDHWRMRGVIQVTDPENPDAVPQIKADPIIERLIEEGIDIDAVHVDAVHADTEHASADENDMDTTMDKPSALRGAMFVEALNVPDELADAEWQLTHTPDEALMVLSALNSSKSDAELRDVVTYLWSENLDYTAETVQLYNQNCAACHGETGNAEGPAASLTVVEPVAFADFSYMFSMRSDVLYAKIRRGGMGTDMPNFGTIFTQEETFALVDYLWRLALPLSLNE